jgi:unsaturated rhamnogalacturonyl hydrolase
VQKSSRGLVILVVGIAAFAMAVLGTTQQNYFTDWAAGTSPKEVGKRVAERFVQSPHQDPKRIIYPEVCVWYGALTFSQLSADQDLSSRLIKRFDLLMTPPEADLVQKQQRHVDFSVFGSVPLEIYIETKEQRYLD